MSQHSLFQQFSPFYLRSEELQMRKGLGLPASVSSFQKIFPFWLSCCPSIILFVFVLRKTIWSSKERKHKVETFEQSAKHFTTNNHFSDKIKDQMLMFYFKKHCNTKIHIIARDFNFKWRYVLVCANTKPSHQYYKGRGGGVTFFVVLSRSNQQCVFPISDPMWKSGLIGRHLPPSSCPWFRKSINFEMVESLFWNPAFDVARAARWWAMSKDWWRLRPGAFLAPASYFFVVEARILGDPWIVGEAKHHSCFLSDIVSVERGHQKPFVRTPLVLQTINQLIKGFLHNMTQEPVYLY